jgi:hypothetical protein
MGSETPPLKNDPAGIRRAFMFGGRPRFWVTLLILMLLLVPAGLGQWDVVIAVIIGLVAGNGLAFLRGQ